MRPSRAVLFFLAGLQAAAGSASRAQDGADPSVGQTAVDVAAEEDYETAGESSWARFGDLRLREDLVDDPGHDANYQRGHVYLRLGASWIAGPRLEIGAAFKVAAASRDVSPIYENELRSGLRLDQAFVRWQPILDGELTAGKTELPIVLTAMVWDDDLRPIGLSFRHQLRLRGLDTLHLAGGYFAADHRFDDPTRVAAMQVAWSIREGAPRGAEVVASYLAFDRFEELVEVGLGRANRRRGGNLASDFDLFDLQLGLRAPLGAKPVAVRFDWVRNLAAEDRHEDDGYRLELSWGEVTRRGSFELGYSAERIQRDAVLGAFNSDDWWNHTAFRGHLAWVGMAMSPDVTLHLVLMVERRDDGGRSERAILNLGWQF